MIDCNACYVRDMIVFESRKVRRLVVRFERGEELVASLAELAREEDVRAAWVRGVGAVEWVELDRHDQARRAPEQPQRFDGPCEVLSLSGHVSLEDGVATPAVYATLSRRTDNGIDLLGGRVVRAGVFGVEVSLDVLEDVTLERVREEATGLSTWAGPERSEARAKLRRVGNRSPANSERSDPDDVKLADREEGGGRTPGVVSWADVAAVSAGPEVVPSSGRAPRSGTAPGGRPPSPDFRPPPIPQKRAKTSEEQFLGELVPQKGDFIHHRQFGLCRVDREDGQGGVVIRLPSGVRKTIKLDFMEVGRPYEEGSKRVYPVRPRRR